MFTCRSSNVTNKEAMSGRDENEEIEACGFGGEWLGETTISLYSSISLSFYLKPEKEKKEGKGKEHIYQNSTSSPLAEACSLLSQ